MQVPFCVYPWITFVPLNVIPVVAPTPLEVPSITILLPQLELLKIWQSNVAFILKLNLPKRVLGLTGNGNFPKSQTTDPVAPKEASKYTLLGVGSGENNTVPNALPVTYVAL